jgi:hypothetical protein
MRTTKHVATVVTTALVVVSLLLSGVPTGLAQDASTRKVLLDIRHSGHDFSTLSDFLGKLTQEGYVVERSSDRVTLSLLRSYSVVFIEGAFSGVPFEQDEISSIRQYVSDGGGLLVNPRGWVWLFYGSKDYIKDHTIQNYPMNTLSKEFGVVSNKDYFIDDLHKSPMLSAPECFADHEITRGIKGVSPSSGVLSTLNASNPQTVVIRGDRDSYSSEANWKYRIYNPGSRPPITTAMSYGSGRVVVQIPGFIWNGDDNKNGTPDMNEYDNLKLALNMFRWLSTSSIRTVTTITTVTQKEFVTTTQVLTNIVETVPIWVYGALPVAAVIGSILAYAGLRVKQRNAVEPAPSPLVKPCLKCGTDLPTNAKFCDNCGTTQPS